MIHLELVMTMLLQSNGFGKLEPDKYFTEELLKRMQVVSLAFVLDGADR